MKDQLFSRALELAGSGACADVAEVRARLRQEGFDDTDPLVLTPERVLELGRRCRQAQIKVRGSRAGTATPGAAD